MGSAKLLARDFLDRDFPYFHVADGRIAVAECLVRVLAHDVVQGFHFPFRVVHEGDFAPSDHAFRAHPIAASHLFVLIKQFAVAAERDAEARVPAQDRDAPPFLRRMQIERPCLVAEIHRDDVGRPVRIRHADEADVAVANHFLNQFLVVVL